MASLRPFYKRNLPHLQPAGAAFFITSMLHNAVPRQRIEKVRESYHQKLSQLNLVKSEKERNTRKFNLRKLYIQEIDKLLHLKESGSTFLKEPDIAEILKKKFHQYDSKHYDLIAYTIMSNHFHILLDTNIQLKDQLLENEVPDNYVNVDKIMKLIKGGSAREINKALKRSGTVWESESFDIMIRNEIMYKNVINYILNNPVNAGLVNDPSEFPFNFVKTQ